MFFLVLDMQFFYCAVLLLFFSFTLKAQQKEFTLNAKIVDENNIPLAHVDIANRRLQLSFAADKYGYFTTKVLMTDTLLLFKSGFLPQKVMIKDTMFFPDKTVLVRMFHVPIELTEVQITAIKTHQQIRKSINNLYVPNTDLYPDAKPFQNPISYLYELISKKEKEKRLAANLQTEFSKRSILKELFRLYNAYDIINLPEEDYDNFITYLNMPYEFMQSVSDYDLAITVKYKFKEYRNDKNNWIKQEIYPAVLDDLDRIKQQNKN